MATAVNTLVARTGTVLNDIAGVRWTPTEVIDWFNEGASLIVQKFPAANTLTDVITLVTGARQTAPADTLQIISIPRNQGAGVITSCDRAALDAFDPEWQLTCRSSRAIHWMPDPDPQTFYVYPAQGAAPGQVQIVRSAIPATMSAGGNITIADEFADKLTNYAIYRAVSKDAETQGAERAVAYFKLVFE